MVVQLLSIIRLQHPMVPTISWNHISSQNGLRTAECQVAKEKYELHLHLTS